MPFDIWLSYHPDAGKLARVRRMIDWTIDVFDPRKNPCYQDSFILFAEFKKHHSAESRNQIDAAFGRGQKES